MVEVNGIALIGAGSEWFWIALQFVALAATFYAIYRQLRAQQREIQESTKVQMSLGYNNAIRLGQRPLEMVIQDEKLARIMDIGFDSPDGLTPVEWSRFSNLMFLQFNAWEFFYYEHQGGQIPKELWVGADAYYKLLIQTKPGLRRFWPEWATAYDEPFRSIVQAEFAKLSPAAATPA